MVRRITNEILGIKGLRFDFILTLSNLPVKRVREDAIFREIDLTKIFFVEI